MSFGISLNVINYNHFNKRISILTEFLPQLTFLLSIFGYLVILILAKWVVGPAWEQRGLLNTLINMFLSPSFYIEVSDHGQGLFPGQVKKSLLHFCILCCINKLYFDHHKQKGALQCLLLLVAFICIPVMLGAKPYLEWLEHNKARALGYDNVADRGSTESNPSASSPNGHLEMEHEEVRH